MLVFAAVRDIPTSEGRTLARLWTSRGPLAAEQMREIDGLLER